MAIRLWRSLGLALGLVIAMPALVAAVPLSSGAGAIGTAAETTSDMLLVKKGGGGKGKHAGGHRVKVKHAKVRHYKVKHAARHRYHRRVRVYAAPRYTRAHGHCHVHYSYRGALRHCHWHRHPHH